MSTNLTIHRLMTEKLAGTISAADEGYLDNLIETDTVVAEAWNNMKSMFSEDDVNSHFSRLDQVDWHPIVQPVSGLQPLLSGRVRKLKPFAWAAVFVGVCVGLSVLYINLHNSKNTELADLDNKSAGIKLKFSNGQVVNLTQSTGAITTNEAQLNNNNKTLSFQVKGDNNAPSGLNTLTVPIGLDYKITLSDGTQVWMNSSTTLRFPFAFNANSRDIIINGEAYIEVAKDPSKPFFVHTPHSTVQVLGTTFNVNSYDSGVVKVSLVEGSVKVKGASQEAFIKPGMQAIATDAGIHTQSFDDEELSWRYGFYYFSNATLSEICKVMPRWFGIHAVLDNPEAANQRFTGRIERNTPIKTFLEDLKATTSIDYFVDNDVIHFK